MNHAKYIVVLLLFCLSQLATAQKSTDHPLPIIDAHLHATTEESDNIITGLPSVVRQMEDYNVVLSVLSGADKKLAAQWKESAPGQIIIGPAFPCTDGRFPRMYPCFKENNGWPELEWLRYEYEQGRMRIMGEMLYVYYGISPGDERLDPYFKLAEELSISVGVHAAPGPPPRGRMPGCCPNFNEKMGNPLLLEPVLEKYPDLRIWLMHGGEVKYHEQAIALMKAYPEVYADLSVVNSLLPEELHAKLLRNFLEAGLEDRIMFGTDNMPAGPILKRLYSFEFLSEKQRRKILYENAAEFFGLSEETIAKHHGR